MILNLLLVDDDATQCKLVVDSLEIFKKNELDCDIIIDQANNLEDGLNKLKLNQYDAAIVDLRLENNDHEGKGNLLIKQIKENLRFPLRVVSGYLGDLDDDLRQENYFYACHTRDDVDYEDLFKVFHEIFSTGITRILNNRGRIDNDITNIFWKHISIILPEFIKEKATKKDWDVEKVLLRYISSHISEYLEVSIEDNPEPFHNIEFYIKPQVKIGVFTGDVWKRKSDESFWIVLTPVCDLVTDEKRLVPKAEFVTMVGIQSVDHITKGKNSGDIRKLKSNSMDLKYHYLPECIFFNGGFINFQYVNSVKIDEIKASYDIELVISNSFKKDIIARFAGYYSRQGQPAFLN